MSEPGLSISGPVALLQRQPALRKAVKVRYVHGLHMLGVTVLDVFHFPASD